MTTLATVRDATTFLFVPGDRPDRFAKAAGAGAELVILDLEDAVAPADKDAARNHVAAWVADGNQCVVRINTCDTPWHADDLSSLATLNCAVMLPKAQSPTDVCRVVDALGGSAVVALIETARGVLAAAQIAAISGIERLAFGSFDLAAEIAVDPGERDALLGARTALVLASAVAGLPGPIDGVTAEVDNPQQVSDDAQYSRRLGFSGKLCIHPRQVAATAEALRPTAEERHWAQRVIDASNGIGVVLVDGKMVDRPVIDRANRILRQCV